MLACLQVRIAMFKKPVNFTRITIVLDDILQLLEMIRID